MRTVYITALKYGDSEELSSRPLPPHRPASAEAIQTAIMILTPIFRWGIRDGERLSLFPSDRHSGEEVEDAEPSSGHPNEFGC